MYPAAGFFPGAGAMRGLAAAFGPAGMPVGAGEARVRAERGAERSAIRIGRL